MSQPSLCPLLATSSVDSPQQKCNSCWLYDLQLIVDANAFSWCSALLQAVVRLAFHPSAAIVYTGCLDGIVRAWDVRTGVLP